MVLWLSRGYFLANYRAKLVEADGDDVVVIGSRGGQRRLLK